MVWQLQQFLIFFFLFFGKQCCRFCGKYESMTAYTVSNQRLKYIAMFIGPKAVITQMADILAIPDVLCREQTSMVYCSSVAVPVARLASGVYVLCAFAVRWKVLWLLSPTSHQVLADLIELNAVNVNEI